MPTSLLEVFDRPWLLALALVLPAVVAGLLVAAHRNRRARLARLGPSELLHRIAPTAVLRRPTWRVVRLSLAVALLAIAAAGPRWGSERTTARSTGVDLVFVLDASLSMLATDERPSRLERMKQEVRRLRALSPGDRVGLIAFAGRSYILTPLTTDDGAIDLFLDNFDPSVAGQPGSSLARPIRQAVELLKTSTQQSDRGIVLFTDGDAHEPIETIAADSRLAREAGIALVAVGFGTTQGGTIPETENGLVTEHRDESGEVVVTRYRPEVLQAVAEGAGGTFVDAAATDKAGRVRRALSTLRATTRTTAAARERPARFQLFVLPALLLLLLDTWLAERRPRRRRTQSIGVEAAAVGHEP
jgi:Ca-activated chloride channel family protein